MPKSSKIDESRVAEACEAANALKKPNISRIAREFGVPYQTLYRRVREGRTSISGRKPTNMALKDEQEQALVGWVLFMESVNMPITPAILQDAANAIFLHAQKDAQPLSKMWVYRFMKRHKNLKPISQKPKDDKRISAEDAGALEQWYNSLARVTRNTEYSETITALECIAADGWSMAPFYIFKGQVPQEDWYHSSEGLPEDTITAVSTNGWINDNLALQWLHHFHKVTANRYKKGEKRILLFDGHGSHKTYEFIQTALDYDIIPFCFYPHSTHICQPLDGKPFLALKQHFKKQNNLHAFWSGEVAKKSEFLRIISEVRATAWKSPRIIRDSFKDRGILPTNGDIIVEDLANQLPEVDDLNISNYALYGDTTPPPGIASSSSVHSSPPSTIERQQLNHAKCIIPTATPKQQRNLDRVLRHAQIMAESADILRDTITKMTAAQDRCYKVPQSIQEKMGPFAATGAYIARFILK
ncbi:transcriptional regulator family: Centromere protein B DNA-binding region [Penicillium manginii]|uniref:transcriptional regulator family: Centromere protein B DNA-binding region n=1 Tax=Penicillium manginii TaxID=203109 RepID=UPI00254831DA|nr:transcriptional regulator family: Centromere protein B DNA-binding region [Penicillium manginii]KAJ5743320.1 transcriptional regulator family: Centromere protein B DNA-binding region [Penicillium manginii]